METGVVNQWGGGCPADRRHCGMLNHLCSALPEQWVCLPDCLSRLQPGSFPVQRPSPAPLHLSKWRTERGPKGPAASYRSQRSRLSRLLIPITEAVGEGLASAPLSDKMANHLLSVADNNILGQKSRTNEAREGGERCDRDWGCCAVLQNNPRLEVRLEETQYHKEQQSRRRRTA